MDDFARRGAERHANADFGDALAGEVRKHAVDANAREQKRESGEDSEQQKKKALAVERCGDELVHRGFVVERLIAGAAAPKLVTRAMVKTMKPGAVLVDIAIDQGGCFETSRPTTHAEPTYVLDGVIHYCVTNMPGAVPRTSTFALTNATLPYVRALADLGWRAAIAKDAGLARGLNIHAGQVTHEAVASALGLDYRAFRAA